MGTVKVIFFLQSMQESAGDIEKHSYKRNKEQRRNSADIKGTPIYILNTAGICHCFIPQTRQEQT